MTQSLQTLSLTTLRESELNPRRHFPEASLAELADNIRQVGVLTPLLVRPIQHGYEIAGGHRRYRAAKRAGFTEVPCLVRDLTDAEFLEIVTLDNLHREDVHPLDEAQGYAVLLAHNELEIEDLAAKVGKSVSYIYQRLKLRDLTPEAQRAFLADEITAGHAILLARLAAPEQKELLEGCLDEHHPYSVRELARQIRNRLYLRLEKAPFATDDATLPGGSCVECPKRTGYNTQLFPDIAEADTCTDRECHAAKVSAWLERIYTAKKCTARVSAGYGRATDGCIPNWRPAGKEKCPDTKKALVVEGGYTTGKQYQTGQVVTICANKKCTVHNAQAIRERVEQNDARKEINAKRDAEAQAKEAALKGTISAILMRDDVPASMWRLVGARVAETSYQGRRAMAKRFELAGDDEPEDLLVAYLHTLTGLTLIHAVLIMLAIDIQTEYSGPNAIEQAFLDEYVQTSAKGAA
ncbi:ParB/RepB/Spo0J family partition protein [Acidiferrobacter sp.]|uniref:ParB/RepB/Spo0J family partition protein n=1 Tax=Acidiferrobacter sp. TaxID=1872107 RepID=UPI00260692B6|nr:ParB/RepB/Spo0J family partition protein [Acidiferrobacter sp.]